MWIETALRRPQVADDAAEGALDAGAFHGPVGGGGLAVIAAGGGEEPGGVAMGGPVFAEGLEGTRRQGDEAVLGALAAMDMDHHAGGVDVTDLEVEALGESEAERVDGPEVGAVVGRADGGDESSDLVDGEDVGEAFLRWGRGGE